MRPDVVDVSSGVEREVPTEEAGDSVRIGKDREKIRAFVREVRNA